MIDKSSIKNFLLQKEIHLSEKQINTLHRTYFKFQHLIGSSLYASDLHRLAKQYEAGKPYWYLDLYNKHFSSFRNKKLSLLEIGVGGYTAPKAGGGSLRMWQTYFPNSTIYGVDIYDKKFHEDRRIKVYQGSQIDSVFLDTIIKESGGFDIVIDDGSHMNEHVMTTFEYLFPFLSENGCYVVEDTHTSYWESFGGDISPQANTTMNFFKSIANEINYEEFNEKDYIPNELQTGIVGIHFYHSIIFIEKGDNTKGSPIRGKLNSYSKK